MDAGPDCRLGSAAHHQRAHGRLSRLRMDKQSSSSKIAVFDLGGGTFDITLLEMGEGVLEVSRPTATPIWVATTSTRNHELAHPRVSPRNSIDLTTDRMAVQRLRDAAEKAKVELSTVLETEINLPSLPPTPAGPSTWCSHSVGRDWSRWSRPCWTGCNSPASKPCRMLGGPPPTWGRSSW